MSTKKTTPKAKPQASEPPVPITEAVESIAGCLKSPDHDNAMAYFAGDAEKALKGRLNLYGVPYFIVTPSFKGDYEWASTHCKKDGISTITCKVYCSVLLTNEHGISDSAKEALKNVHATMDLLKKHAFKKMKVICISRDSMKVNSYTFSASRFDCAFTVTMANV